MTPRKCRARALESSMKQSLAVGLIALTAVCAYAAGMGLKAGLWEVRMVKQVIDDRDMTAQMSAQAAQMQQMMASMPPEQRAKMEEAFKQRGISQGGTGGFRMCVTPEMAKRDAPIVDREGRCQPASFTHSGNQTTFEFSCTTNGNTTAGKGEAVSSGDLITTRVDMTIKNANGQSHVMHNESEMKFLGSDCGDVKPIAPPVHAQ
jgi:Protein of unknown function (DUF3617)